MGVLARVSRPYMNSQTSGIPHFARCPMKPSRAVRGDVMQAVATTKYVRMSAFKVRQVTRLIQGKPAVKALELSGEEVFKYEWR